MLYRLIDWLTQNTRTLNELYAFHRAEMREAGVTDAQLTAFLQGR